MTFHCKTLFRAFCAEKNKARPLKISTVYTSFALDGVQTHALKMICNLMMTEAISPNLRTVTVHYNVWLVAQ